MPPTEPDLTARLDLFYHANGKRHHMLFRALTKATLLTGDFITQGQVFWTAIQPWINNDFVFESALYAEVGSTLFLPGPLPAWAVVPGAGAPTQDDGPRFVSFQAVTTRGRKWRLQLKGIGITEETAAIRDYRIYRIEDPTVCVAALDALDAWDTLKGRDGGSLTWHQYINYALNSGDQQKLRT